MMQAGYVIHGCWEPSTYCIHTWRFPQGTYCKLTQDMFYMHTGFPQGTQLGHVIHECKGLPQGTGRTYNACTQGGNRHMYMDAGRFHWGNQDNCSTCIQGGSQDMLYMHTLASLREPRPCSTCTNGGSFKGPRSRLCNTQMQGGSLGEPRIYNTWMQGFSIMEPIAHVLHAYMEVPSGNLGVGRVIYTMQAGSLREPSTCNTWIQGGSLREFIFSTCTTCTHGDSLREPRNRTCNT